MEPSIKCDLELLKLLEKADKKDIDYLVDVLTDEGKGRIALSSSVKDLLLSEKETEQSYSKQALCHLLRELQEYGGHSVLNQFRNEPLPYSELLTDVHSKLNGIDSKKKSHWKKEQEIVLSLFGKDWQSLDDRTRWERCTDTKVVTGFFNMPEKLALNADGITNGSFAKIGLSAAKSAMTLLALRWIPPMIVPGLAHQGLREAYRITIPFIAHIAMLKMRYTIKSSQ